jgi:EpsI family protein
MVNRRYTDVSGHLLTLYVAYYAREGSRAQAADVCGSCELLSADTEVIDVGGSPLMVNRALIRQGGVESLVLYWFHSGGAAYHHRYREKLDQARRMLGGRGSEGGLVRITAPVVGTEQSTLRWSVDFVRTLVPQLRPHFQT